MADEAQCRRRGRTAERGSSSVRLRPFGVLEVLRRRGELRRHTRLTAETVARERALDLQRLRRFALERSPFYRDFHAGVATRPLEELPILTKELLMENWDSVVTDRALHLSQVEDFLRDQVGGPRLFGGRYYVAATSGSSGRRGVFAYRRDEWQ